MEVAIIKGTLDSLKLMEVEVMRQLSKRDLETANDSRPRGSPEILAMSQSQDGDDITITIIYRYRL